MNMKTSIVIILFFIIIIFYSCTVIRPPQFGKNPDGERLEKIKLSPNFKNGEFQNITHTEFNIGFRKVFIELLFNKSKNTRPSFKVPVVETDLDALDKDDNFFIWFGHSSYLLKINNNTFLVDPVLSSYASPVFFINRAFKATKHYSPHDIPSINYLLITHDHYDHLDYKTVMALKDKVDTIICPLGVGSYFEKWGFKKEIIIELDWNQSISISNQSSIHAVTARHFSGRGFKRNKTLWASYILKTPDKMVFIGSDGGYGSHYKEISNKFGEFDLVFLENGQYNKLWPNYHAFPEENAQIALDLKAKKIMPIHWGKFSLSTHSWDEPIKRLIAIGDSLNLPIITPKIGEIVYFNDSSHNFTRWWEK